MKQERNQAVADALAGTCASLVSLWLFYPIDVWKIKIQANVRPETADTKADNNTLGALKANMQRWFRGIHLKTLHSTTSSFCYFYLYSWIMSTHLRRRGGSKPSTSSRLLLSALAAMLNTCITLPFDVLSTRYQSSSSSTDAGGDYLLSCTSSDSDLFCDAVDVIECENADVVDGPSDRSRSHGYTLRNRVRLLLHFCCTYDWQSLWKGVFPALLLCTNPAINYTVFDVAKVRFLGTRSQQRLTMIEAFLLGLVAKFSATIVTYPLIQAKVKLMTSTDRSLLNSLLAEYKRNGVKGLYRGCDLQLLHTLLKSALLMMLRERITRTTHRLLLTEKQS